jgi:FkbM family methyltransferase
MSNGDEFQKSVLKYRVVRRAVRAASVLWPWKRKQVIESALARLFGDVAEADGHLLEIEPRDRSIGARLRRTGRWDPCEKALYEREVRPGMTVVDAGANVGYFSLLFARWVGPTGRVYAFEPDPGNFNLLERNIKRNGYGNVTAVPMALSRESGRRKFSRSSHNFADHCLGEGLGKRELLEVEVVRLDDFFADIPKKVDFLKLDIQGAEFAAIDGARELLRANPEIVLLTEFWPDGMRRFGDDPERYLAALDRLGFSLRLVAGRSRPELRPIGHVEELFELCTGERAVNLFGRMV